MKQLSGTRADFGEKINVSFGIDIRRPTVSRPTVFKLSDAVKRSYQR